MSDNVAVVIDNGSGEIKAGFAGDVAPTARVPSVLGQPKYPRCLMVGHEAGKVYVGETALKYKGLLNLSYPITHGCIKNPQDLIELWNHVYLKLSTAPTKHPLLITESPLSPKNHRKQLLDIVFNSFDVPAVSIAVQAVLGLYSSGRSSGLVVDCGDGVSSVVPIYEGYALTHAIRRADIGGRDVTNYLATLLRFSGKAVHASSEQELFKAVKESACIVSHTPLATGGGEGGDGTYHALGIRLGQAESQFDSAPGNLTTYKLPDGSELQLSNERRQAPELLFNPGLWGLEEPGVQELLKSSLSRSDLELRRSLASQIVLAGGATMQTGFIDRILYEMRRSQPKDSLIKVFGPPKRELSTFVGGCILAGLSTFKEHLLTKRTYEEEGPSVLARAGL